VAGTTGPGGPAPDSRLADAASGGSPNLELEEQNERYWAGRTSEERQAYIEQLDESYQAIVNEFLKLSNASVDEYKNLLRGHTHSRRQMIWMTGFLAMLNVVVTFVAGQDGNKQLAGWWSIIVGVGAVGLPVLVALYAATVAIFSNLESLENHLQRAQHYRQSRETSLSAFRELEMLWHLYVRPFSDTPTACVNAANLYRRAVARDREVRGQVMEKSPSRPEPP
jgi:hypothetical protein